MASVMKVTWFFNGAERGWTESLAMQRSDDNLVSAVATADAVAQLRAAMLGREYSIEGLRVARYYDNFPTGARITNQTLNKRFVYKGPQTVAWAGDSPDAGVQAEFANGPGDRKKLIFLGGIPDAIIVNGGGLDTTQLDWQSKFNTWASAVIGAAMGWITDTKSAKVNVSNFVADNATGIVTFTVPVGTFGAGPYKPQSVRFSGLNGGHCPLNRQLVVQATSDTTCVTVFPIATGPFRSPGKMLLYGHPMSGTATITAQQGVDRKRGRPTLQPLGRARKRVVW